MEEVGAKDWGMFYLSWADEDKWQGCAFVPGYGPITARLRCVAFGVKAVGQCMILRLPKGEEQPPMEYRDRLLNEKELREVYPDIKTLGEGAV